MRFLKLFVVIFFIVILTGCINQSSMQVKQIKINDKILKVEVAETLGQMVMGLSSRVGLKDNEGMLFKYLNCQSRNFHMKDMNFPLDFIWIKDNVIVGLSENVSVLSVDGNINKIKSPHDVNLVLEVNSGWVKTNIVKVGDMVYGLD